MTCRHFFLIVTELYRQISIITPINPEYYLQVAQRIKVNFGVEDQTLVLLFCDTVDLDWCIKLPLWAKPKQLAS